jgi:hypothetical protein
MPRKVTPWAHSFSHTKMETTRRTTMAKYGSKGTTGTALLRDLASKTNPHINDDDDKAIARVVLGITANIKSRFRNRMVHTIHVSIFK